MASLFARKFQSLLQHRCEHAIHRVNAKALPCHIQAPPPPPTPELQSRNHFGLLDGFLTETCPPFGGISPASLESGLPKSPGSWSTNDGFSGAKVM